MVYKEGQPLVSIVIPVYNGSDYLSDAIDCALAQTYENCEVLVINDGSEDGGETEAIALSYGDKIRYFKKQNGGVASALNLGIRNMRGEYFSWLSHDDQYYPDKIKKQIEACLTSGDPHRLVVCNYDSYDMGIGTTIATELQKYYTIGQLTKSLFSVLWLRIYFSCTLIHVSHFERVGVFDESLPTTQDWDMLFRLFRNQESVFVPDVLCMYRENYKPITAEISQSDIEMQRMHRVLIEKLGFEEMEQIFGSAYRFLIHMIAFEKSMGWNVDWLEERINQCKPNPSDVRNSQRILQIVQDREVFIYGAGQYGIRTHYKLNMMGVQVQGFLDNSPAKQGQKIVGTLCSGPQVLKDSNKSIMVFLAMRAEKEMKEWLRQFENVKVITTQEFDGILALN